MQKGASVLSFSTLESTVRRRLLWLGRVVVLVGFGLWTGLVAAHPGGFSPCSFTGGLAGLSLVLHLLDYPDVVNF